MSVDFLLRTTTQRFPFAAAVSQGNRTINYAEFDARVDSLSHHLSSLGLGPDTRACVLMENRPEILISYMAIYRCGSCLVPLNPGFILDDIKYHVEDSGADVLIHSVGYDQTVASLASEVRLVNVDGKEASWFEPTEKKFEAPTARLADPAWLFYTSGTTGRPKGATLTHSNLLFVVADWLADLERLSVGDRILHVAPLTHGAGFHSLAAIAAGAHQMLLPGAFDPNEVIHLIEREKVTGTFMVPTHLRVLLDAAQGDPIRAPHLRNIIYGGASITRTDLDEALHVFGDSLVQIYAQGETPMTGTILRHRGPGAPNGASDAQLHESAGLPRIGMQVSVVNSEDSIADPDAIGEIVVRGPAVMAGYWNNEQATADTLRNGWLHTGDLGRRDGSGYIYVLDRMKDLIITGGQNVYAKEVEDVLRRCPGVTAVAVIGLPDRKWGEAVTAAVVTEGATESDIAAFAKEHLAGFKRPKRFVEMEGLPTSAYGKILKRELRKHLTERAP